MRHEGPVLQSHTIGQQDTKYHKMHAPTHITQAANTPMPAHFTCSTDPFLSNPYFQPQPCRPSELRHPKHEHEATPLHYVRAVPCAPQAHALSTHPPILPSSWVRLQKKNQLPPFNFPLKCKLSHYPSCPPRHSSCPS